MKEIYVSIDVETNGPIPGPYSMLSLGAVAFLENGTEYDRFSMNLELLPNATSHPATMAWWRTKPIAWEKSRENPLPPLHVMRRFRRFVNDLPGTPIFVADPVSFDWKFVDWYFLHFCGETPFDHNKTIDIKSYALGRLGISYAELTDEIVPEEWALDGSLDHVAVEDAAYQGRMFFVIKHHALR